MRDGINIARLGIPVVALVTEDFWPQGDFIANSLGMPDVPRVLLPHPVAGTGAANLRKVAEEIAPKVFAALAAG
ncbi:MAG: hypothetical protein VB949_11170 [Pseudomonadales bacterium]